MYLEGIFIGGDIRSQLQEEAKKFDQIDKTWKRVGGVTLKSIDCLFHTIIPRVFKNVIMFVCLCVDNVRHGQTANHKARLPRAQSIVRSAESLGWPGAVSKVTK